MARRIALMSALLVVACGDEDETMDSVVEQDMSTETAEAFSAAEGTPGTWTWIPVGGAKCRDGSDTGFLLRLGEDASEWLIYLEGGGACFNSVTCLANPNSFGAEDVAATVPGLEFGVFDRRDTVSPVAGWNAVYVPYCTGDVFAGNREGVSVAGVSGTQDFVGFQNIGRFTDLLVDRYSDASRVLLTGSSAGGFGALLNFDQVATKFSAAAVDLVDDSGHPMRFGPALAPCLAQLWQDLWDIRFPVDCSNCDADQDGFFGYSDYLSTTYPESSFALASYMEDEVIRFFFGFGEDDCTAAFTSISASVFSDGVDDIRTGLASWGTYYVEGDEHTFLRTAEFEGAFSSWLGDFLDGTVTDVGP
ncbi:MAG: pectin acetylesterase-family hydrolase [Myxococcota bacterium]